MTTDTRDTIRYNHENTDTNLLRNGRTYVNLRIGTNSTTLPVLMGAVRAAQRYSVYNTHATNSATPERLVKMPLPIAKKGLEAICGIISYFRQTTTAWLLTPISNRVNASTAEF